MKMSKLLKKAQLPSWVILIGIAVVFSLQLEWLHKWIPSGIYKLIEILSIVLVIAGISVVFWKFFKERDTGKVPAWSITAAIALILLGGLYLWKGDFVTHSTKSELVQENPIPDPAIKESVPPEDPAPPVVQPPIDSAKNADLTKEEQEEAKIVELENKIAEEKKLFTKDSTEKVAAAERQCKRDKRYEQLRIEIEKVKKAREALVNQPIVPNCGDQVTVPEKKKETTRIATTNRKKHKKRSTTFGPPVASGPY